MFIDILVILAVALASMKGYKNGLIMALFNTASLIIGLAAAVKLSSVVGPKLAAELNIGNQYLPFISFALVFLVVVIIIRLVGNVLQKTLETVKIGFINRLAGIALYLFLYLAIASILVYYMNNMGFISEDLILQSATYPYLAPFGLVVMEWMGSVIPYFKDMFNELNIFFDGIAEDAI